VQPTEAADAVEVGGQDVLEEAAKELEGMEVDVPPGASAALTERPAEPAIGQALEWAVAGGGLEDVAAEVWEGFVTAAHSRAMDDPALLPHLRRQFREGLGVLLLQRLAEECASAVAEGLDGQEELGPGGLPMALVAAEAAAGNQAVDVRMICEGAGPGVEHGQQAESGAEALGVLGQVLQGLGTGAQEQVVAEAGVRADPAAQAFGHSEGDQEIGDREQQGRVGRQPLLGVLSAALGAMPIIAGVVGEVTVAAIGAIVERPAQRGGAAGQEGLQHLALAGGHGGTELGQIGRSPLAQDLVNG
jgi:hypothetical protein